MNAAPLLSIITVCFNDLPGLMETEVSIKKTTSPKALFEWIVIDGDSSDGTKKFLAESPTITRFVTERDNGIYDAMNKGTNMAVGNFVIYMNSGDIFTSLDSILESLHSHNFDLLFYDARFIYGDYSRVRKAKDFTYITHGIPANHQAIAFKRSTLGPSPYDTTYKICGDYKLLADLYNKNSSHKVIHQVTAEFKVGGVSTNRGLKLLNEAYNIQRKTLGISFHTSALSYARRAISITLTLIIHRLSNAKKRLSKPQ